MRGGRVAREGGVANGVLRVRESTVGVKLSRSEGVAEAEDEVWTTSPGFEADCTSHSDWQQDSKSSESASNH